jgi:4-aminobutyrate--pyruvate transaminase
VICGFGRTGNFWGSQTIGIEPDIITCAKAISAGTMPISAILLSRAVTDVVERYGHELGYFAHGYTYGGHPVACAVALETLKIYEEMDVVNHLRRLATMLHDGLHERFDDHPLIGDIRGVGFCGCIEIVADKTNGRNFPPERKLGARFFQIAMANGLITRAGPNDSVAVCPPYITTEAEVGEILDLLATSLDTLTREVLAAA